MSKIRVIVEVADGMAYVYTDKPEKVDVVVVDHDTDGVDDSVGLYILQGDGLREPVILEFGADMGPEFDALWGADMGPEFDALWESIQNAEPYKEAE